MARRYSACSLAGVLTLLGALGCGGSKARSQDATGGNGGIGTDASGGGGAGGTMSPGGAGGNGGTGLQDAASSDSGFAADFADRVRAAVAQGGTPSTCASALPAIPVASAEEARAAVGAFVAEVRAVAPATLSVLVVECGTPTTASCAGRFQHDLYKSNGIYGESLYPLAVELESRGSFVEETIWSANDGSSSADVCISGVVDGLLVGVVMFNGRQTCP